MKLRALIDERRVLAETARRLQGGVARTPLFDLDHYTRTFERVIHGAWNDLSRKADS